MHSPNNAAGTSFQLSQRANHFSFPPTQRSGLPGSTTTLRSRNQRTNLQRSYRKLLDSLTFTPLEQATAR